MSANTGRLSPASGYITTPGHGPAPSGVANVTGHVPSGVAMVSAMVGMSLGGEDEEDGGGGGGDEQRDHP
jgi:hypothetical protein